jgi:hypothetical protein
VAVPYDTTPYFATRACSENDHEIATDQSGKRYCRHCKFSVESLTNVIGHDVDAPTD